MRGGFEQQCAAPCCWFRSPFASLNKATAVVEMLAEVGRRSRRALVELAGVLRRQRGGSAPTTLLYDLVNVGRDEAGKGYDRFGYVCVPRASSLKRRCRLDRRTHPHPKRGGISPDRTAALVR